LLTRLRSNGYEAVRVIALDDPQTLLMSPLSTSPRFCEIITTTTAVRPRCPMDMEVVEVANFLERKLVLEYSIWPPIPFRFRSVHCEGNWGRNW
jgi:hypothetical protein